MRGFIEKQIDEIMDYFICHRKLFYNLKELSRLTGVSHRALKERIKRGTLLGIKDGNTYLVPSTEAENLQAK